MIEISILILSLVIAYFLNRIDKIISKIANSLFFSIEEKNKYEKALKEKYPYSVEVPSDEDLYQSELEYIKRVEEEYLKDTQEYIQ